MERDGPEIPGGIDISVPHCGTVFASEHGVQRFANVTIAKVTPLAKMLQGKGLTLGAHLRRAVFGDLDKRKMAKAFVVASDDR